MAGAGHSHRRLSLRCCFSAAALSQPVSTGLRRVLGPHARPPVWLRAAPRLGSSLPLRIPSGRHRCPPALGPTMQLGPPRLPPSVPTAPVGSSAGGLRTGRAPPGDGALVSAAGLTCGFLPQPDDAAPKKQALYLMFDTSQESPVKSPPVRMSESPTPCSGYEFRHERLTEQARGLRGPCAGWRPRPGSVSFVTIQAADVPVSRCPRGRVRGVRHRLPSGRRRKPVTAAREPPRRPSAHTAL